MAAYTQAKSETRDDLVAVEAPLHIVVDDVPIGVTMRTPGQDDELACGLLVAEGVLGDRADLTAVTSSRRAEAGDAVQLALAPSRRDALRRLRRHGVATSACGLCGRLDIDRTAPPLLDDPTSLGADAIVAFPARVRRDQSLFAATGGLHAAALFDATGELVTLREDVGRHNAVDKVIGERFLAGATPLVGHVLVVTSRASFEIVQKAAAARIPVLVAVGAPSSLAIDLAEEVGLTLVAFVRDGRFNVYTGHERITGLGALS